MQVNNAPVAIPGCASGPGASCPLASFAKYVDETRAKASGDFVQTCGLQNVSNATSAFTAFTEIPEDSSSSIVPLPV
jgi:acid phosphatase